jgi:hypothetical protein
LHVICYFDALLFWFVICLFVDFCYFGLLIWGFCCPKRDLLKLKDVRAAKTAKTMKQDIEEILPALDEAAFVEKHADDLALAQVAAKVLYQGFSWLSLVNILHFCF